MNVQPDKPIVIAFVGMPGSGKDTCTDYLVSRYKTPLIYFGGMVYDEVARRGLDIVKDETAVRQDMRAKEGNAVLAKRVAQKAHQYIAQGHKRIVLNGLYSWSEYKWLRQEFGDQFVCIAIVAPRALRYQRVVQRKDAHRKYTIEQIQTREIAEIENLEKGGPIAYADFTLPNTQTPQDLYDNLETTLAQINF